jgi:hypothetical protein
VIDWWCYQCGDARNTPACPVCGLKAPGSWLDGYAREKSTARNDSDDSGGTTSSELEDVHSTLKEILSTLKSKTDFSGLFWVALVVLLLEGWSGSKLDRWTDKAWYSVRYDAEFKNIAVEKRPLDCDFFRAPLGNKGCEYKKTTNVFADEERKALVQQATTEEQRKAYEQQPNSVAVYWEKKPE